MCHSRGFRTAGIQRVADQVGEIERMGRLRRLLLLAACLVVMLADLLAAADLASEEELDRLTALFSDKLREAVSRRDGPVGHA